MNRMNGAVYNKLSALVRRNKLNTFTLRHFTSNPKDQDDNEPQIPENPYSKVFSASQQPQNGRVYDNKPFKMPLKEGKTYMWCLCGHSKTQPLCDGTHKLEALHIKLKPVKFIVTETKEYWICNCKQTGNRPFCDGTHKSVEFETYTVQRKK